VLGTRFFLVFALALLRSSAKLFALALLRSFFGLKFQFRGLAFELLRSFFVLLDFSCFLTLRSNFCSP
jgi:hypothetical protein